MAKNNKKSKKQQSKKMNPAVLIAGLVAVVLICGAVVMLSMPKSEKKNVGNYTIDLEIQDYGHITMELDGSVAPETVENFVTLAKDGFYDGLTFHRIMEGFMMQGGDPLGNGTGGSETKIKGEFAANGVENKLSHTRGAVSMARSMDYNSASSQFFIVHEDSTQYSAM